MKGQKIFVVIAFINKSWSLKNWVGGSFVFDSPDLISGYKNNNLGQCYLSISLKTRGFLIYSRDIYRENWSIILVDYDLGSKYGFNKKFTQYVVWRSDIE